ncbi:MAG TPA: DUF362 domain-containing protein [Acidobacteriota bacterium]|nr:DUF362 domain-containing protein [Acidobacteriota bacterium]
MQLCPGDRMDGVGEPAYGPRKVDRADLTLRIKPRMINSMGREKCPEKEGFDPRRELVWSRRRFLQATSAAVMVSASQRRTFAQSTAPVALARCRRYDVPLVRATLRNMFDQIGGVSSLVKNKTVTIKVNLTGGWNTPVQTLSPIETVYTHPAVALAAATLFSEFGARRIVLCESTYSRTDPQSTFQEAGYPVDLFNAEVPGILWEDTRNVGTGATYREVQVRDGGVVYDKFFLNHRYVDTDVMVSIAKMKNHEIAGVTLAMKNMFGITPSALYSGPNQDENSIEARIAVFHEGTPSAAGGEVTPVPFYERGLRVPNIIVDILQARPVDLCIIDGIVTTWGGEGAWHGQRVGLAFPALLAAGRNPVCTDAVAAAAMGYDPMVPAQTKPFYEGENMIALGAGRGIGTHRLEDIEVVGLTLQEARYDFPPTWKPEGL